MQNSTIFHQLLARNLKKCRMFRRLSQEKLADAAAVSLADIQLIESGQSFPYDDMAMLEKIVKVLDFDLAILFSSPDTFDQYLTTKYSPHED
jgi:transcriptional regulator with XRE-family HTH domain